MNLDYEDVQFTNKAGLVLRGWYVPGAASADSHKLGIVCVHGGGRDRRAWLRHIPIFHNRGYDILLFDFSEHGVRFDLRPMLIYVLLKAFPLAVMGPNVVSASAYANSMTSFLLLDS